MAPGRPLRLLRLGLGAVVWAALALAIAAVVFAGSVTAIVESGPTVAVPR